MFWTREKDLRLYEHNCFIKEGNLWKQDPLILSSYKVDPPLKNYDIFNTSKNLSRIFHSSYI